MRTGVCAVALAVLFFALPAANAESPMMERYRARVNALLDEIRQSLDDCKAAGRELSAWSQKREEYEKLLVSVVVVTFPDWQQTVRTGQFADWLRNQPGSIQELVQSADPRDAIALLKRYYQSINGPLPLESGVTDRQIERMMLEQRTHLARGPGVAARYEAACERSERVLKENERKIAAEDEYVSRLLDAAEMDLLRRSTITTCQPTAGGGFTCQRF